MRRLKRSLVFLTVTVMLCGSLLSFGTAYANEAVNSQEELPVEPITDVPAVASVGASEIVSGKIYRIKDANSGLYLTLPGNDANLSNINVTTKDNAALNQQFKIVYDETYGFYRIHTMMSSFGTNRVLDINSDPSNPPANGKNVHIYVIEIIENFNSYGWQIIDVGNDKVKIVADYNNSLALTVASGGTTSGTNVRVNTYSGAEYQTWILEEVVSNAGTTSPVTELVDGGIYRIKDKSGKYLTVAPNTAGNFDATLNNVEVQPAVAHLCQEFKVERNDDGTYYLRAMVSSNGTNRLVDVYSSNIDQIVNGANVHLHHPGDENSSRWQIEYLSVVRAFTIKIACKTNLGMAVSGTNVQMASFHGGLSQQWFFEPVASTVEITADSDVFYYGGEYYFDATVYPVGISQEVTWTSVYPNVATVESNGRVIIVGEGVAVITATSTATGATVNYVFSVASPTVVSREGIYYLKFDNTYNKYLTAGNISDPTVINSNGDFIVTTAAIEFDVETKNYDSDGNEIEDERFLWSIREMSDGNYTIASMGTRYYGAANNWGIDDYVLTVDPDDYSVSLEPYEGRANQMWELSDIPANNVEINFTPYLDCWADLTIGDAYYSIDDENFILEEYEVDDFFDGGFEYGNDVNDNYENFNVLIAPSTALLNYIDREFFQTICNNLNFTLSNYVTFEVYQGDYNQTTGVTIGAIGKKHVVYIDYSDDYIGHLGTTYFDSSDLNDQFTQAKIVLYFSTEMNFGELSLTKKEGILIHEILHAIKMKHPNSLYEYDGYETNEFKNGDFVPSSIMISGEDFCAAKITDYDYANIIKKINSIEALEEQQ